MGSVLQGKQLDVLEPDIGTMILQSDIAGPRMILVCETEFVSCAVTCNIESNRLSIIHRRAGRRLFHFEAYHS